MANRKIYAPEVNWSRKWQTENLKEDYECS